MADIEDTLLQNSNIKDMNLSIYREIDDIVADIHGKEKNLKTKMDDERELLSSTNKSMNMSAFSPDQVPQPFESKKKGHKKGQEKDKYKKYRPSQNLKENDLYQEMGSLMDESYCTSGGRSSGQQTVGQFKFR